MRVISGIARGYKLFDIDNVIKVRPTTDRVKESIFNMICSKVYKSKFLDLYSGTGAIGIEALSRGAKKCVFVDKNTYIIEKNLNHIGKVLENGKSEIIKLDVDKAIGKLYETKEKFDIIFMDPPYNKGLVMKTLKRIYKKNILDKEGIIILEQSKKDLKDNIEIREKYKILKSKIYGSISIMFLNIMEE